MVQLELTKGTKDWSGSEAILRNEIRDTLREIFERYGYNPIETPMLETVEALGFKGGGEIQKEVFTLEDKGGRRLGLRFDQTVPLARFVATHPEIVFPFKRYTIGEVFRDGKSKPESGRFRIFTQCDVDVLGIPDMTAEVELFALARDAFEALGLGAVEVKVNNRKLLEGILEYAGVPDEAKIRTILTLDKIDKIGAEGIREELVQLTEFDEARQLTNETLEMLTQGYRERGKEITEEPSMKRRILSEVGYFGYLDIFGFIQQITDSSELFGELANHSTRGKSLLTSRVVDSIMDITQVGDTNDETYKKLEALITSQKGREGVLEIRQVLDYGARMGLDFIKLDPCLARGLDYYTGTTIEVFLEDRTACPSAILAGGRFDNMIGEFRGGDESIPAVGFSFGLERLALILAKQRSKLKQTYTQLYIIPVGDTIDNCLGIADHIRHQGINVDIGMEKGKKVGRYIVHAQNLGVPYVGMVGESEIAEGAITIKNLQTRKQETVQVENVGRYICDDQRNNI